MEMPTITLGVIIGTRNFFADSLVSDGSALASASKLMSSKSSDTE